MPADADQIPSRSRLTIAALTAVLALPVCAGSCGILLARGVGTDGLSHNASPSIVAFAILVVGWIWIYETGSRLTGEKIDGRPFSMAAVAVGAMLGVMCGLGVLISSGSILFAPVVGALLGALAGTYVRRKSGRSTNKTTD